MADNKTTNSTFTDEQKKFIVLKYGELKTYTAVRRAFATKFHPKSPRNVSAPMNLHLLAECSKTTVDKCMAWTGIVDGKCLPVCVSKAPSTVKCT